VFAAKGTVSKVPTKKLHTVSPSKRRTPIAHLPRRKTFRRSSSKTAKLPPLAPQPKNPTFTTPAFTTPAIQTAALPSRRFTTEESPFNHIIVAAFAAVLGIRDVNPILALLSEEAIRAAPDDSTFFLDQVRNLTPFERIETADGSSIVRSGRSQLNRLAPSREYGTFGVLFRSDDGLRIYKSITLPVSTEENVRNVFIETFIQTMLSCDPTVGSNICRPVRLFRGSQQRGSQQFYLLMEPIQHTFDTLIEQQGGVSMTWLAPIFSQLGNVLASLKRRYAFSHRDLHIGNVLITDTGKLKLIDFGFSCLQFRGLHYHATRAQLLARMPVGCAGGFDLAQFFTSFMFRYASQLDLSAKAFFSDTNFSGSLDGVRFNLFTLAMRINPERPPHAFYYYNIQPHIRALLDTLSVLNPTQLVEVVKKRQHILHASSKAVNSVS
jgi:hypothetical protein